MLSRYHISGFAVEAELGEEGDWCKWEDVEQLLAQKDLLISKLYANQRIDAQCIEFNTKEESK